MTAPHEMSDLLAAERTFLAWIRTGLALMGFGFVVARFGLFLEQLRFLQHGPPTGTFGPSVWFGTVLIALGVLMTLLAARHHLRLVTGLRRGGPLPSRPTRQAVAMALLLALIGVAMAIYLVSVHSTMNRDATGGKETSMAPADRGIVNKRSKLSVDHTVDTLKALLQSKGVTLFALVDHSGEASKVGIAMPPTKLLIFGNPSAGTPIMLAAPSSALDLPLKILVWEDVQERVWVSYNSPQYLQWRHSLPADLLKSIAITETLALNVAER